MASQGAGSRSRHEVEHATFVATARLGECSAYRRVGLLDCVGGCRGDPSPASSGGIEQETTASKLPGRAGTSQAAKGKMIQSRSTAGGTIPPAVLHYIP